MKSDVIKVSSTGEGFQEALGAASASAEYRGATHKEALHLRLLAEEMLGMVRQITGETRAEFWVESAGKAFELHLVAHPIVTGSMRKELLKVPSSGKNAAAKGFMGKLRDIFDRALSAEDEAGIPAYYAQGYMLPGDGVMFGAMSYAFTPDMVMWSMQKYKAESEETDGAHSEEWDELEKSIVANIADEVRIAIAGDKVEMIVYKKFVD